MSETKGRPPAGKTGAKRPAKPAARRRPSAVEASGPTSAAVRAEATRATAAGTVPAADAIAPPRREKKAAPTGPTITILQVASGIGCPKPQRRVLRALGLKHPHHRVVRPDHPSVRGMVAVIPHLVRIVEESHGA